MKTSKIIIRIFALLLCIIFSHQTFGNYVTVEQIAFEDIFTKVVDGKHYLKEGIVHVTAKGIFLCAKGEMVSVPAIEADEEGAFIRKGWPTCPICGWPLTLWGTCSNPGCPTKG